MLVPHSEKRTVHFQISVFAILFLGILFLGLMVGFFWFSLDFSGQGSLLASRSRDLAETEASLDIIREEVGALVSSSEAFRQTLSRTMNALGLEDDTGDLTGSGGGDLASLFSVEKTDGTSLAEVTDLQQLKVSLDDSVSTLEDIGLVLSSQKELLSDIPTIWPLERVRGYVTQIFGPSINPFTGQWYLHRGLDLAFGYGVSILATANGKVTEVDFDEKGFGHYVVIRHNYGFKTKFAHLQRVDVRAGQEIAQGEAIGTMGNSGLSTGPHLHYEVMIGSQLVDPVKFLNMTDPQGTMQNITRKLQRYR